MNITLAVDQKTAEKARRIAQAMGKSLNQVVRDYLEQLAGHDQIQRDIEEFRRLSTLHGGRSPEGWKFNREEIYDRKVFSR